MQTFARLLSFVTFLLSVGFLAQALPTTGNGLVARDYSSPGGYNGGSGYSGNSGYNDNSGYNGGHEYSPSYGKEASPASKEGDHDPSNKIDILDLVTKLHTNAEPICKKLEIAPTVEVATHLVDEIVVLIKALIAVCVNVKLDLSVDVKTQIAVKIVAFICLVVKALAAVCVKLGVDVCLALIAKVDVCLQLLLITLNVCIDGLLAIIISLCLKLDVSILAALKLCKLELLIKICGLVNAVLAL
ncbi:hypothetical protein RSOLAG22IIIB_10566 [Rhizoctonia solani]|uniref:Uncharacterized protein n=1 Tax=Rhizoctonia solani TaxID=456999 RepID=A0A0K6G4E8_9AGAM|nr:hypothetical protein RSOLAG22IIIB_10566 [Rhizoctonia solani]